MKKTEQEILTVLLNALYEKGLVSKEIHEKAREEILCISNCPEWFRHSDT